MQGVCDQTQCITLLLFRSDACCCAAADGGGDWRARTEQHVREAERTPVTRRAAAAAVRKHEPAQAPDDVQRARVGERARGEGRRGAARGELIDALGCVWFPTSDVHHAPSHTPSMLSHAGLCAPSSLALRHAPGRAIWFCLGRGDTCDALGSSPLAPAQRLYALPLPARSPPRRMRSVSATSMAAQSAALEAADTDEAPPATTIASLPHALLARVLARVPVDTRLRCAEVCRDWRTVLTTERSLWTALDLSPSSGLTHAVTDALLRAAAAKAGGALETLDVTGAEHLSYAAVLQVVTFNAASLSELRVSDEFVGADPVTCDVVDTLLRAAPQLRHLIADLECDVEEATRALRSEGIFQPLRVRQLFLNAEGADDESLRAFTAALSAHVSPLSWLVMNDAQLDAPGTLDAVVGAALANQLSACEFDNCRLSPAYVPSLARLLGGAALKCLHIYGMGGQLLDAPAAALLGDALRKNSVLKSLSLCNLDLWRDGFAAVTLLASLTAHPSLEKLQVFENAVSAAHAAGMAIFALVAANTPALTTLNVSYCGLGDAGLRPLLEALPRNAHLRTLYLHGNGMSDAFARDVLLPAVRANTSLTALLTHEAHAGAVEAEAIVNRRRRAADAT
jgi:hypothetical protein